MKYALEINITHESEVKVQEIVDAVGSVPEPQLWQVENGIVTMDETGRYAAGATLRFHAETDRMFVMDIISDIEGLLMTCEIGSYVREHRCFHDETPPKPCEIETLYEVTP